MYFCTDVFRVSTFINHFGHTRCNKSHVLVEVLAEREFRPFIILWRPLPKKVYGVNLNVFGMKLVETEPNYFMIESVYDKLYAKTFLVLT